MSYESDRLARQRACSHQYWDMGYCIKCGIHANDPRPPIHYDEDTKSIVAAETDAQKNDRIASENAEAQWGLRQCHLLARRALNAQRPEKRAELLGHILRICEQQSAEDPRGGVLRDGTVNETVTPVRSHNVDVTAGERERLHVLIADCQPPAGEGKP